MERLAHEKRKNNHYFLSGFMHYYPKPCNTTFITVLTDSASVVSTSDYESADLSSIPDKGNQLTILQNRLPHSFPERLQMEGHSKQILYRTLTLNLASIFLITIFFRELAIKWAFFYNAFLISLGWFSNSIKK